MRSRLGIAGIVAAIAGCGPEWEAELDVEVVGEPERVIVIGAGISGLTAARALANDGREVIVLEARDRIGGRTWTKDVGGVPIDLGGAWLHGQSGDNPAALVMAAHGATWRDDASRSLIPLIRDHTGETFGALQMLAAQAFANNTLFSDRALRSMGVEDTSAGEAVAHRLDEKGSEGADRRLRGFVANQAIVELDYAGPTWDTSVVGLWEAEGFPGGDAVPEGGYAVLVEALAADLDVRLSEPVTAIDWSGPEIEIGTANGRYQTTHAVITLPLGVLRSGAVAFEPALPESKQGAIERLDMGNLEKVVLSFDERFWADEGATFVYLDEEEGRYPTCVDFTEHAGAPTLICFTGGGYSRYSREHLTDEQILEGTLENLAETLDRSIPAPSDAAVTRWSDDPWSQGSYSFIPVGATVDDLRTLAEPVDDRLLFAGEHTAGAYNATVHGALISGLREARRLGVEDFGIPGLEGY